MHKLITKIFISYVKDIQKYGYVYNTDNFTIELSDKLPDHVVVAINTIAQCYLSVRALSKVSDRTIISQFKTAIRTLKLTQYG